MRQSIFNERQDESEEEIRQALRLGSGRDYLEEIESLTPEEERQVLVEMEEASNDWMADLYGREYFEEYLEDWRFFEDLRQVA